MATAAAAAAASGRRRPRSFPAKAARLPETNTP